MAKRFYWLKLKQTFFNDIRIKKLRRDPAGDSLIIIYIQLLLMSLETDGKIFFGGVENSICEEIALGFDCDVSLVQKLLQLLEKGGLLVWDDNDIILTQIPEMTGSETESAERMRRLRRVQNETETSHCDANVKKCDVSVTLEKRKDDIEKEQSKEENKKIMCKADACALFEKLWILYPNKRGKGQVSISAKQRLLKIGYDEMARAIERYKSDLEKDSDWRKPQNGSTFFNSGYIDYLDENYKKPTPKKATSKNQFNQFQQHDYDFEKLESELLGN